jgi:hypothetical protein
MARGCATEVLQMLKPEVIKAKAALAAKIKSFAAALRASRNSKEIFRRLIGGFDRVHSNVNGRKCEPPPTLLSAPIANGL